MAEALAPAIRTQPSSEVMPRRHCKVLLVAGGGVVEV
jgi:hypothetical protein